jgi:hypothetical protein
MAGLVRSSCFCSEGQVGLKTHQFVVREPVYLAELNTLHMETTGAGSVSPLVAWAISNRRGERSARTPPANSPQKNGVLLGDTSLTGESNHALNLCAVTRAETKCHLLFVHGAVDVIPSAWTPQRNGT